MTENVPDVRSKATVWIGRVLSGLIVLFMLMDAGMKLVKPDFVVKGTVALGYSESTILPLGVVLLVSTILHAIPQTAMPGAILLSGYPGGAADANVRASAPLFSGVLMPVYCGIVVWLGLLLRDARLQKLPPIRTFR